MTGHQHGPDCDPILRAGFNTCGQCGTRSYPVAAAWVSETLILTSFGDGHKPGCPSRHQFGTVLLDMTSKDPMLPVIPRPRICRGTTTAGRPCRSAAAAGSAYCHWHDPARQRA